MYESEIPSRQLNVGRSESSQRWVSDDEKSEATLPITLRLLKPPPQSSQLNHIGGFENYLMVGGKSGGNARDNL